MGFYVELVVGCESVVCVPPIHSLEGCHVQAGESGTTWFLLFVEGCLVGQAVNNIEGSSNSLRHIIEILIERLLSLMLGIDMISMS